jgi:glycosyltransferase involved in cell wall biosynthesis
MRGELDPLAIARLHRRFRRFRPEVALVNMEKAVRLTAAARVGLRLPIVRRLGMCLPFPEHWRFRLTYRHLVAHLVVNAAATARLLARRHRWLDPSRLSVIPGAIDGQRLAAIDRQRARQRLEHLAGSGPGQPILVTVARIERQKRPEVLVDALARLTGSAVAPVAVWLGTGGMAGALASEARQRGVPLVLPGYRHDAVEFLAGADLLVHPSEAEGMPHAVLEAMALGVPVVASAVDGIVELLEDGRGSLVPVGDGAALAAAIGAALEDRAARSARAAPARAYALRHHDRETMLDRYETLLSSIAASRQGV